MAFYNTIDEGLPIRLSFKIKLAFGHTHVDCSRCSRMWSDDGKRGVGVCGEKEGEAKEQEG